MICCWFISIGGWKGFICFLENIIDSDLEGLNETSHLVAHRCILSCPSFAFGFEDWMWDSIALISDRCLFIYFSRV